MGFSIVIDRLRRSLSRFGRDEDGTLIIFALMLMVVMLMMGGFAIDLMRYEATRTRLQNTLDRATLAAASLTQNLDPNAVVQDYMMKAGLADQLNSIAVTEALNERIVHTTGIADTKPLFLHLLGINKFDAVGNSEAQQSITNVEIVLVLDVSGSMAGQKIANLKIAADEFVDTVMGNDPHHRVSIAIVPYNAQVNIGPDLAAKFNLTHRANVQDVNCVEVPVATAYATEALSLTDPMPMMAYADIAYGTNQTNGFVSPTDANYAKPNFSQTFCKPTTVNIVRLPQNDPTVLKSEIDALQAGGNTSITLGMKWGVTMIDPTMRAAYTDFEGQGLMPTTLTDRPFDYSDPKAMKIVVLMTDGEHVSHNRINDDYKTGPSPIFKAADGNYSVYFASGRPAAAGTNTYYVPHLNNWQATPWNNGVQQDWADIWANLKLSYVAWQFYARALGTSSGTRSSVYTSTFNAMQSTYDTADHMDTTLQTTCDQARANGVQIYGITIEGSAHGNDVITGCAHADHTFLADRNTIRSVFQTIAANLTQLKLTQ